jgi:TolA-binding protein
MKIRALRALNTVALVLASTTFGPLASAADEKPTSSQTQSAEFAELKAQLAQQQQQIEQLRKTLEEQKKLLEGAIKASDAGAAQAASAPMERTKPFDVGQVASTTPVIPAGLALKPTALPSVMPTGMPTTAAAQAPAADAPSPLQIHIGEATITPVGFMDLTNTFRSTNAGTSLQTNFGSIPYNNTIPGRLTEDKFSAANSRIGFRVDAKWHDTNIMGYYEGDFVGGVAGNNTQVSSNSLLYRIRLYWVDARKGQFEVLAGQSWSMMTPNRKAISALPADLFYSQVVDVNYMNGLTWGRIPGIRFLYHPTDKITFGLSLENAAQYFGGSGGGGTPTLPAALSSATVDLRNNELDASVANGVAIANVHPDIIAKLAFDPSSRVHFEFVGVERTVRLFNPLQPPNPGAQQHFTKAGGGGSVNGNFEIVKNFRLITNNYWSDGGGRYLFGIAPDFIVRADGSPSLIHSGSTLDGFEATLKNTAIYGYYGGVYIGRNTALDANGTSLIGYGYRGSPNSQNKTTQEASVGLTQTLFRDSKYGALQIMLQYAYLFRDPWFVAPGAPKNTHEHAIWFNLRYLLPGSAPTIKY